MAPARADLTVDFEAAIEQLPPGAREIFVLHDVEGYKHREIAAMLRHHQRNVEAPAASGADVVAEAFAWVASMNFEHREFTDQLSDYLDDELSAGERAEIEAHLAGCAQCAAVLG